MSSESRTLLIEAGRGEGVLEIAAAVDHRDPAYFTARLSVEDLEASVRFYEPRGFLLGLGDYFASVEQDWRGWKGEKTWESVEGELSLTAIHDGLGHITLTAELRNRFNPPSRQWLARGALSLEAGALGPLAQAAARFERASLT